jgi:hypothetical protein
MLKYNNGDYYSIWNAKFKPTDAEHVMVFAYVLITLISHSECDVWVSKAIMI